MDFCNLLDRRSQTLGAQPPTPLAYLTKGNPKIAENPLLTHIAQ